MRIVVGAFLLLNLANAATVIVHPSGSGKWLLLGLERNPSTWCSSALLAVTALVAWVVGRGRADRLEWRLVAGILGVLSLDEVATFHEKLGGMPGVPHLGSRAWTGLGAVLVLLVGAKLLPWALRLEPRLRFALFLGAATYVLGAVGMESMAGSWEDVHGQDRGFWVLSTIEEDFEMLGVAVVLRFLLAHLRAAGTRLTLAFTP